MTNMKKKYRPETAKQIKKIVPQVFKVGGLTPACVHVTAAETMFIAQSPVTAHNQGLGSTVSVISKHHGKLQGANIYVRKPKHENGAKEPVAAAIGVLGYHAKNSLSSVVYKGVIERVATAAVQNCIAIAMRRHEQVRLNAAEICEALGKHLNLTLETPNKAKPTSTYVSKLYALLPTKKQQATAKRIVGYNVGIAKRRLARYIKGDPDAFTNS